MHEPAAARRFYLDTIIILPPAVHAMQCVCEFYPPPPIYYHSTVYLLNGPNTWRRVLPRWHNVAFAAIVKARSLQSAEAVEETASTSLRAVHTRDARRVRA